jgi:hypothetical protein
MSIRVLLRVLDLDNRMFERLARYEAALWREVRQYSLRWKDGAAGRPACAIQVGRHGCLR